MKKGAVLPPSKTEPYVSTLDAAAMLGVSIFSVQRWFDEGLLKGGRLPGGKRRILSSSLNRFMQEHGVAPRAPKSAEKERVLLVEDDARVLEVMKDALAETGRFVIQTATSGLDAGLAVSEFQPDVIVLDVLLDDVHGATLVKRIRQSPVGRQIRIIAISGKATAEDVREIKAAGANAFLSKPFSSRDLLAAIKPAARV